MSELIQVFVQKKFKLSLVPVDQIREFHTETLKKVDHDMWPLNISQGHLYQRLPSICAAKVHTKFSDGSSILWKVIIQKHEWS